MKYIFLLTLILLSTTVSAVTPIFYVDISDDGLDIITNNDIIEMKIGETGVVLVDVANHFDIPKDITLRIDGAAKPWSWFEGYKYTPEGKEMKISLKPREEMVVSINVMAGERGTSSIILEAENEGNIKTEQIDIRISSIAKGNRFASAPGLEWSYFILIILIGSLIYQKK